MIDGKSDKNECLYETNALLACVEIGKVLTSTLDLKQILELIMVKVSLLIEAQNWSLLLKNETTGELTFDIAVGINSDFMKGVRLEPGEGISGHVVRTGIPMFLSDVEDDPRFSRKVDELTYCLHVILRFELELALIDGEIKVSELPGCWNEKMDEMLGVTPKNDKEGVLQDMHWSGGSFGYFPTYAIGTIYASQLFKQLSGEKPDITEEIERGDFTSILAWLREHVHKYGCLMPADERYG